MTSKNAEAKFKNKTKLNEEWDMLTASVHLERESEEKKIKA